METLLEKLLAYENTDYYPFHMPGHKRLMEGHPLSCAYGIDITEIDGFDNLHHPEGILKEAQENAARVFGSEETFFLVNGSTAGILAAICAVAGKGQKVLAARGCHKAVYHAILLQELEASYLYPDCIREADFVDGISPAMVAKELDREPDIGAVIITSPTYEGVVSDVAGIARLVHERGIPLVVDAAHGAHFGFHPKLPESPVKLGADLVVQSVHKTLSSFTQTALLHVNGELVDRRKLRSYLHIFQSSSPSYILMSGIDWCVRQIQAEGSGLWEPVLNALTDFYEQMKSLKYLYVVPDTVRDTNRMADFDRTRVVISTRDSGISGQQLYRQLLEQYHLQMEMAAGTYVVAIVTMQDTQEGLGRIARALLEIDGRLQDGRQQEISDPSVIKAGEKLCSENRPVPGERVCRMGRWETGDKVCKDRPEAAMPLAEAFAARQERISLSRAAGRISGDYVHLYPPGTPIVVPGERLTRGIITVIEGYLEQGLPVLGLQKDETGCAAIYVVEGEG